MNLDSQVNRRWTGEDDLRLLNGIRYGLRLNLTQEEGEEFWATLTALIFPHRWPQDCKERYTEKWKEKFSFSDLGKREKDLRLKDLIAPKIHWSPSMDQSLLNEIRRRQTWEKVAKHLNPVGTPENKRITAADCEDRYLEVWKEVISVGRLKEVSGQWKVKAVLVLKAEAIDEGTEREPLVSIELENTTFSYKDIEKLIHHVGIFSNWSKVEKKMESRHSAKECREYYEKYLELKKAVCELEGQRGDWHVIPRHEFVERNDMESSSNKRKRTPLEEESPLYLAPYKKIRLEEHEGTEKGKATSSETKPRTQGDREEKALLLEEPEEDLQPDSKKKEIQLKAKPSKKNKWNTNHLERLLTGYRKYKEQFRGLTLFSQIAKEFFSNKRTDQACFQHFLTLWSDVMRLLDERPDLKNKAVCIEVNREEGEIKFTAIEGQPYDVRLHLISWRASQWSIEEDCRLLEELRKGKVHLGDLATIRHPLSDINRRGRYWRDKLFHEWDQFMASTGPIRIVGDDPSLRFCVSS